MNEVVTFVHITHISSLFYGVSLISAKLAPVLSAPVEAIWALVAGHARRLKHVCSEEHRMR